MEDNQTYFAKDRYSKMYRLYINGKCVGEVKTRKEAREWWEKQRVESSYHTANG